jgi:hypothetical protein
MTGPVGARRVEWVDTSAGVRYCAGGRFGGIKCGRAVGSQMARSDLRLCAAWARSGMFRLGVVVLVGLLAGAGCSDGGEDSGLPEITDVPTTSASPSGSPTWTPEQQAVIDAVTAYGKVSQAVLAGAPVDMKRIRSVAAEPFATIVGKNFLLLKSAKIRTVGKVENKVLNVVVRGRSATLVECVDARDQQVVSSGSTNSPTGPRQSKLSTYTLILSGNRWLMSSLKDGNQRR